MPEEEAAELSKEGEDESNGAAAAEGGEEKERELQDQEQEVMDVLGASASKVDETEATVRGGTTLSEDELLAFVLPSNAQHPLSLGRLYALALYGPLDMDGNLRAGIKRKHVLQGFELEAMCKEFEREDILAVYIHDGGDMYVLTEDQKQELIAQADSHMKSARGRAMMAQLTEPQILDVIADVPRDDDGRMNFHEFQECIVAYREKRVSEFKRVFPNLTSGGGTRRQMQRQQQQQPQQPQDADPRGRGRGRTRGRGRRGAGTRVSGEVAPASMFRRDQGLNDQEIALTTNRALCQHSFKVCEIEDGNNAALTQNVWLIRDSQTDGTTRKHVVPPSGVDWNGTCCIKNTQVGALVKSTPSSTTWKRKH